MNGRLLAEYRKLRRFYFSPVRGIDGNQPKAAACLRLARIEVWFADNWGVDKDNVSDDGQWRIRIEPDPEPYDTGDLFDYDKCGPIPGGRGAMKAQEKRFWARINRDGVWGYILERRSPICQSCGKGGEWETVDSCWGFDDADYCKQEAIGMAHYYMVEGGK